MFKMNNVLLERTLIKGDCTVLEIRSLIERQLLLTDRIDFNSLLCLAIIQELNVDIVEELLKHLGDINQTSYIYRRSALQQACRETLINCCDKNRYNTIKLLLSIGANVNITGTTWPFHATIRTVNSENKFFIPILQLMLQYADKSTKTYAIQCLLSNAAEYGIKSYIINTSTLTTLTLAIQLFLESGTPHEVDLFRYFFETTVEKCVHERGFKLNLVFLIPLYELVVQYIFARNFREDEQLINYDIKSHFENIIGREREKQSGFLDTESQLNINLLFDSVRNLWNNCFYQCHKMNSDILKNNRSLLQTLKDLCYAERKDVPTEAVHEIMLKLVKDDYYCFTHVMSQVVKNSDMTELYSVIAMHQFEKKYILHPDCYRLVAKLLSKDDQFNYLLALLPVRRNLQKRQSKV